MSNSSAGQIDYSPLDSAAAQRLVDAEPQTDSTARSSDSSTALAAPQFDNLSGVRAHAARIASRINARSVPQDEIDQLLRTRNKLLDKKLSGTATRQELNRLEYVRWSLDRIEDAQVGDNIDRIEDFVTKYENFLAQIEMFRADLRKVATKK